MIAPKNLVAGMEFFLTVGVCVVAGLMAFLLAALITSLLQLI